MKSRWTIRLLAGIAVVVWGAIGWKIFRPSESGAPPVGDLPPRLHLAEDRPDDTLRCAYSDPFTRAAAQARPSARRVVRRLHSQPVAMRREAIRAEHLATICVQGEKLFILAVNGCQYELRCGEAAGEFILSGCDGDSLYLERKSVKYGVKLCE